jgi:hypothetical protein
MSKEMIMGRELVITTNLSNFDGVPCVEGLRGDGTICLYSPKLPTNIILGKTYYYIDTNGNLVAFRIKAFSITQGHPTDGKTMCLVETPFKTFWSNGILSSPIFNEKEDYYNYLASGQGAIKVEYDYLSNDCCHNFSMKKTYYWSKALHRPQVTETNMHFVLITDTKVYFGVDYTHSQYSKKEMGYASGEDCIKANIDGMKIIEFAEPKVTINLHIEEPKEPKVRVLKFID